MTANEPKNNGEKASHTKGQQEFVVNKKTSKVKVSLAMGVRSKDN